MRWMGVMLVLGAANPATAADVARPKVAVPNVVAEVGVPQGAANLLGEIINADIQHSGKYDVISSADITTVIGYERTKQLLSCTDDSCLSEIGNALGADLLLRTTVGAIGNLRVLAVTLIDTKKGCAKARQTETVSDDGALVDAGHRLVARLLDLPAPASAGMTTRRKVGFGVLGGVAVLSGVGAYFGVSAENGVQSYQGNPSNPALASSAQSNAHAADAFFGAAVVAGAAAIFLIATGGQTGSGGGSP